MARYVSRPAHDDLLLWTRFLEGDVQAWGDLLDFNYRVLFNYGLRLGANRELVHDCIHDLFLDLWDGRQRLHRSPENVVFYLLRSFRNKLIREQQKGRTQSTLDESTAGQWQESTVEDLLTDQETTHINSLRLKNLLASLPARQQEVLYLKFYVNLSNSQLAEVMNLRPQSAANLLHVALQRLRSAWGVHSGFPALLLFLRWLLA
ncbi:MAG: sigma-70 family RNA polymerase sigma factor [Sphingobacteriaceae bacterium]|nr:sigma-70 family RNA polymerase sigma factor [Cytophagaceae bacterium]